VFFPLGLLPEPLNSENSALRPFRNRFSPTRPLSTRAFTAVSIRFSIIVCRFHRASHLRVRYVPLRALSVSLPPFRTPSLRIPSALPQLFRHPPFLSFVICTNSLRAFYKPPTNLRVSPTRTKNRSPLTPTTVYAHFLFFSSLSIVIAVRFGPYKHPPSKGVFSSNSASYGFFTSKNRCVFQDSRSLVVSLKSGHPASSLKTLLGFDLSTPYFKQVSLKTLLLCSRLPSQFTSWSE